MVTTQICSSVDMSVVEAGKRGLVVGRQGTRRRLEAQRRVVQRDWLDHILIFMQPDGLISLQILEALCLTRGEPEDFE